MAEARSRSAVRRGWGIVCPSIELHPSKRKRRPIHDSLHVSLHIRVFLSPARGVHGPRCTHFKPGGNCMARMSGPVEDLECRNHRWL